MIPTHQLLPLFDPQFPLPVEASEELFLLPVDANDGHSSFQSFRDQIVYPLELLIPIWMRVDGLFYWFLQREFFLHQTLNRIVREMIPLASETRPDLRNTLVGPAYASIHRISSNVSGHDLFKDIKDLWVAIFRKPATASGTSRAVTLRSSGEIDSSHAHSSELPLE